MIKHLSQRIKKELGINMYQFCEDHLKTDYRTFQYRMRKDRYYPAEVIYICWLLDDTCENLFGKSFAELVLFDGPGDAVAYVKKKFLTSSAKEKQHLMDLIGFQVGIASAMPVVKSMPPKPIPFVKPTIPAEDDFILNMGDEPEPAPKEEEESGDFNFDIVDINLIANGDESRYGRQ